MPLMIWDIMLRKIGHASHVARDGRLVIKLVHVPPLNVTVYEYSMRRVGTLYDIIGPVSSPYGLVKLDEGIKGEVGALIGKPVYIREVDMRRGDAHLGKRG